MLFRDLNFPRLMMNKSLKFILLILFLSLNFSCVEHKTPQKEIYNAELTKASIKDSLKFTSGIRAILQDSKGNYWLGSHQEGVCRFDGASFEYFRTNDGLAHNQVRSIQEDEHEKIWFGTANGVSSYQDGTLITHSPFFNGVLLTNWVKTANDLWFNAGNQAGVYNYDGQKLNYLPFPSPKKVNPNNSYFVTGIAKGANDMLWIATYAGVFGYDGSAFTVINDETLALTKEKGLLHVRSVFEDSKGRLWIGNNGIGLLLKEGDSIINFSEKNKLIHSESLRSGDRSPAGTLEHVFAIREDHKGNIWFGDRDTGAWKYDGKKMTKYDMDKGLKSSMIWCIHEDQDQNLLFGMAEGGVYQFNGDHFERKY